MAFVKLRNVYGREIKIPASAAKSYRNLGFYPAEEFDENAIPAGNEIDETANDEVGTDEDAFEVPDTGSEKTEDEIFVETVTKKPLASWNKDEVKRYAAIYNIDLTGTKSANDAKERIKAFMSDAE